MSLASAPRLPSLTSATHGNRRPEQAVEEMNKELDRMNRNNERRCARWLAPCALGMALWSTTAVTGQASGAPLRLGYSDWPGWVAWQIAIDKGWLKQAGLDASFDWFDYSASIDAFTAGRLDGNFMTNGDALVMGAGGARNIMIMVTDYSNGNDMIVARPGIHTLQELKGRKIGIEIGLVEHLLLLDGLKKAGMQPQDVTLVNTKTNETPQVLASGQVDAVGAWQPNSGLAMRTVPGAHPVYSSAEVPGMIYDVLAVRPATLAAHRAEFLRLIQVWQHIVDYINDPQTQGGRRTHHGGARGTQPSAVSAPACRHAPHRHQRGQAGLHQGRGTAVALWLL